MKSLLFLACFLSSTIISADCVNLSHKTKIAATDIEVKQINCSQLSRQMFYKGEAYGDANIVDLDGKWKIDSVDDQYESFSRQVRWSWNSDESILIYDYIMDSIDKGSGEASLSSGTQIYKKTNEGKISYEVFTQIRIIKKDGSVSVDQGHNSEIREPLL